MSARQRVKFRPASHRPRLAVLARELMVTDVETTDPRASLVIAAEQMRRVKVGALVVLDQGTVIGIFTERDVVRSVADGRVPALTHVSEYMTQSPRAIRPGATVAEAASLMRAHRIRHLPVTDDHGRLLGLLSARTLLSVNVRPPVGEIGEPW